MNHSAPIFSFPQPWLNPFQRTAYEQFIFETDGTPTRTQVGSNGALHDPCNALMWLHYPYSKTMLNALQAATIKVNGIQSTRARQRRPNTHPQDNAGTRLQTFAHGVLHLCNTMKATRTVRFAFFTIHAKVLLVQKATRKGSKF